MNVKTPLNSEAGSAKTTTQDVQLRRLLRGKLPDDSYFV
jgi:hypothetical protein